ncbi:MAG: GNAT family N-acetyltransferase [Actinomycetota bacterium]
MSDGITIRPAGPEEFARYWDTAVAAFGWGEPPDDMGAFLRAISAPGRMLAAVDGDDMVAVAGAFPFRMTVPGGEVPAAGVTLVGVLPSHRRRGILTRLMERLFDDATRAGEPVAYLWASEDAIYQRFGFGMAALFADMQIERHRATFLGDPPPAGRVRLLTQEQALDVLPPLYETYRLRTPGAFARSRAWWQTHRFRDSSDEREGGSRLRIGVWECDGEARGYALWRTKANWVDGVSRARLQVAEAVGLDPEAVREVWQFLFSVDLVEVIGAEHLAADHPLQYLVHEPRRLGLKYTWPLWVRVVDAGQALEARGYAADGSLVLEVADRFRPANAGRWRLEVSGGRARCEPTSDAPDLRLTANELGATYLGGTGFGALARAGRVQEPTPGAARRADDLFRSEQAPWCPEIF